MCAQFKHRNETKRNETRRKEIEHFVERCLRCSVAQFLVELYAKKQIIKLVKWKNGQKLNKI